LQPFKIYIADKHAYKVYVNVKVRKLSQCIIKYHAMKRHGGILVLPYTLSSALDGVEWFASYPSQFTAMERVLDIHSTWVGPQSQPGNGDEEKNQPGNGGEEKNVCPDKN
jgi:hypothetical protein